MKIIKSVLTPVLVIAAPVLAFVLPLVGMLIGGALLALPGILIGTLSFDDIPAWYFIIFMLLPGGIGMLAGAGAVIERLGSSDSFKKADRNIDKGVWDDYMNR